MPDIAARYDGATGDDLARRLGVPLVVVFDETTSTLDVAHILAAKDALAGTLVVADAQTAGRGRFGRSWTSERGAGIWLTLIERPRDPLAIDVLSLRVGLAIAPALDRFAHSATRLKWPNDVCVGDRKLAGILVEARWRETTPEWIAIGIGINIRPPASEASAAGLVPRTSRISVLEAIVPGVRAAAACAGVLSAAEVRAFESRDLARGRVCEGPVEGIVQGIDAGGALLVDVGAKRVAVRSGSLILKEEH